MNILPTMPAFRPDEIFSKLQQRITVLPVLSTYLPVTAVAGEVQPEENCNRLIKKYQENRRKNKEWKELVNPYFL
jgi:hypothetical protein